jgi:methionine-rich copper-binding protein CopC
MASGHYSMNLLPKEIVMHKLSIRKIIKPAFLIATLLSPIPVFAHAILVKSQPAKDETVQESPKRIDLWFNDAVRSEYKALAVIDSTGKRVDNHDVEQTLTDGSNIHASVPNLTPGVYTVRYRVVSEDTHIVTGKFEFTVKP